MDSQVFRATVHQQRANGVGHATDSNLKTGTILDFGGNAPCHYAVNLVWLRIRQLRTRLVIALDDEVDLARVHPVVVAEGVGHLTIDLHDYQLRLFDHCPLPKACRAKRD